MTHSNAYLHSSLVFCSPSVFVHPRLQMHGQADRKLNVIAKGTTHHCHSSCIPFTEGPSECHRINAGRRRTDHKYLRTTQQKYKELSITHCAAKSNENLVIESEIKLNFSEIEENIICNLVSCDINTHNLQKEKINDKFSVPSRAPSTK